jgi:hypothetical protein
MKHLDMKKILSLILLLIPVYCFSSVTLNGKLIDTKGNPLPYANIFIKNSSIGVISNLEGEFSISIPERYIESSLVFSSMGFKTKEVLVNVFKKQESHNIKLETAFVNLDEVTIKIKATNANEIVQKALDHYEDNFPTTPFIGKAFLRHTEKTKTKYKWLIDAAIEVYDPGFNQPSKEIKLNINEIKRSIDNRSIDTASIYGFYLSEVKNIAFKKSLERGNSLKNEDPKEIQKSINFEDNRLSNPNKLFSSDLNVIRYYKQKDAIFDKNTLRKHNFKIDTVLSSNSDEIYKIKITPKSPLVKLNKHYGKMRYPIGWIFIRAKDYAIVELDYTLIRSKKGQILTHLYGSKIASSFHIKFFDYNGKMYPKHIILKKPKANNALNIIDNKIHNKETNSEDYYYESQEVIFNQIVVDHDIVSKKKDKLWNSNLFTPRPYNSQFWESYSNMVETVEQRTLRKKLELELQE